MLLHYLLVFFVSMLPVVELRLSVPLALSLGIPELNAIGVCVVGNIVPVPFLYLFARKVLLWGQNKRYVGGCCRFLLTKGEKAGQKLTKKAGRYGMVIALILFVGIPLPGTGAWTGAMAASFLNLGLKTTTFSVAMGVILAGVIMLLGSMGVFHIFGL